MRIVNVRGMKPGIPGVIYCGRRWAGWEESLLCNHHPIKRVCPWCRVLHTKKEAIDKFRWDLYGIVSQPQREGTVQHQIIQLLLSFSDDTVLGCWCVDKEEKDCIKGQEDCHCEIIIRASRYLKEKQL